MVESGGGQPAGSGAVAPIQGGASPGAVREALACMVPSAGASMVVAANRATHSAPPQQPQLQLEEQLPGTRRAGSAAGGGQPGGAAGSGPHRNGSAPRPMTAEGRLIPMWKTFRSIEQLLQFLTKQGEGGMRASIAEMEGWDGSEADISWRAGRQDLAKRMTEAKAAFQAIQAEAAKMGQLRGGPCTLLEAARLLDKERKEPSGKEQKMPSWIKRQDQLLRQSRKNAAAAASAVAVPPAAVAPPAAAEGSGKKPRKKGAARAGGSSSKQPRKTGAARAAAAAGGEAVTEAQ
ncbi:hypothetical protein N2152v2_006872 [Parachlorella kessleri]